MATDYFTMMQDVVGGYGEGVDVARKRRSEDEKRTREKTIQDREDETYNRAQTKRGNVDSAAASLKALDGGLIDGSKANWSQPVPGEDLGPVQNPPSVGLGAPRTAATPLDYNRAYSDLAMANEDYNGAMGLQEKRKGLQWDQTFGERLKGYTGSDEQVGQAAQYLNTSSKRVSVGDPDKNGIIRMSVVKPDGRADFVKLTKQDQAQLYAAAGMMELDPTRALTIMSGVNKELAAAYAADNNIEFKLAEVADRGVGRAQTDRHNRAVEADSAKRTGIAGAHLGLARTRANEVRKSEPDPELVAKYNDLMLQSEEATDPKVRAALDQQMRRVAAQISTKMGKPMQVRSEPGAKGDGAFKASPEAGSIGTVNGQRVQVQADGSYGAPGAETNPAAFVAAKYPDLVQSYPGQFSVTPDGKGLYIGTREDYDRMGGRVTAFDYKNPRDMAELANSLRTQATGDSQADTFAREMATRGTNMPSGRASATGLRPQVDHGIGPKLTNPNQGAPGIYASDQEWANYRKYQADKKQTNAR